MYNNCVQHVFCCFFFFITALHEDACRKKTQMLQVQQWLQHRVGSKEAHRGLWEDVPLYVWLPLCQQGCTTLTYLQDRARDSHRTQARMSKNDFFVCLCFH